MIRVENQQGVTVVTIDRPEKKGAVDLEHRLGIADAVETASADPDVRGIVLTGTDGSFCAGGDVSRMGDDKTLKSGRAQLPLSSQRVARALYHADKPVIAAVDGPAAGFGWSLALAGDRVIATRRSKFVTAFARIGLVPDGSLAYFMRERIGPHATRQLIYSAATLTAEEALQAGLVDALAEPGDVVATAVETALQWTATSAFAFGLTKKLIAATSGTLEDFLAAELLAVPQGIVSEEHKVAVAAFRNRKS